MKKVIILILIVIIWHHTALSNGVSVNNINVDQSSGKVSFVLRWYNSWYYNSNEPSNYDAVWIFIKFRDCSDTVYTHGLISETVSDHLLGSGNNLQFVDSNGNNDMIDASPNNTGVLLKRKNPGFYFLPDADTITLKLTNLPATGDIECKVFAIEMVYVLSGKFYIGDGNTSSYEFRESAVSSKPVLIESEASIGVYDGLSSFSIPAGYPKGYDAFFIMKYEISQQQYADFLNTLNNVARVARFPGNFGTNRNRLNNTGSYPMIYFTDRPHRAQNFLSWADISAYLDWACLSPLSECQYEKACRGNQAYFPGEYAWGSKYRVSGNNISGIEDGTETMLTGNHIGGNITFTGGDGGSGPARCGIFATNSSNREEAGASFYGVMDMCGNVFEWCVKATSTSTLTYHSWGDGYISYTGFHNVANWPSGTVTTQELIIRGGSWALTTDYFAISNRIFANTGATWANGVTTGAGGAYAYNLRTSVLGGRGVR